MGQEEEHLAVELVDPLAADAPARTDLGEGVGGGPVQPIAPDDQVAEAGWQRRDQGVQRVAHLGLVEIVRGIGFLHEVRRRRDAGKRLPGSGSDRGPDGTGNRRDGVAAEVGAARRVVASKGVPQTDPTRVQGVGEGEITSPLLADNPANQTLVAG